jgi:predicted Zn-dependent protease
MRLHNTVTTGLATLLAVAAFAQDKPKNADIENIGNRDINKGTVNFISIEKEIAMGRQLAAEIERQVKLLDDPTINEYVNRVGQNLVRNSDAKLMPTTFKVVQSTEFDTRAIPGGFVYLNTGLIAALDNEAELAFVLAYQVAHIAARHGTENASKGELINFDSVPLIFMGSPGGFALHQASASLIPMQFLQMARSQAMEADLLGMEYLYQAGYDPRAAITLLQKVAALESSATSTPKMLSPTPPAADRIAAMERNIALILPARSQNVLTTPEFDRIKANLKK